MIEKLREAILGERYRVIDHADDGMVADRLRLDDVPGSVADGEIIEQYPTDRPFPSCLIYGNSGEGVPIHSVWAYNDATGWAALITAYRPDPDRWVDFRRRKHSR